MSSLSAKKSAEASRPKPVRLLGEQCAGSRAVVNVFAARAGQGLDRAGAQVQSKDLMRARIGDEERATVGRDLQVPGGGKGGLLSRPVGPGRAGPGSTCRRP